MLSFFTECHCYGAKTSLSSVASICACSLHLVLLPLRQRLFAHTLRSAKEAGPPDVGCIFMKLIACDFMASWNASRLEPQAAASMQLACDETDYERYSTSDHDS